MERFTSADVDTRQAVMPDARADFTELLERLRGLLSQADDVSRLRQPQALTPLVDEDRDRAVGGAR